MFYHYMKYFSYLCTRKKKYINMMKVVIYSILYMFGIGENPITTHKHDDYQSIQSDWEKVGMDIYRATQKYEQQKECH